MANSLVGHYRAATMAGLHAPVPDGGGAAQPRVVAREVLRLAGPAIMASLMQTLVFLADRLMLGRYSQEALASMQVQGPLLWSVFSIFMGALVGTVALVARSVGAGKLERARTVARTSLRVAAGLGVVVGMIVAIGAPFIAWALGPADEVIRSLSTDYMRVAAVSLPAMFVGTTCAMILQGSGDTRTPFLAGFMANVVNIILNWMLIYGTQIGPVTIPDLGVVGAGIGSAAAFVLEAVLLVVVLRRPDQPVQAIGVFRRDPGQREAEAAAFRDLFRISGPAILDRIAVHAGFLAFVRVITLLGPVVMAANQALITVESICFLSADGFGIAAATVVGQQLGRGDERAARWGGLIATGMAVVSLVLFGGIIWLTGEWSLGLFVPPGQDGSVLVATGLLALPLLALAQPFMACGVVLAQGLRGAGDTRSPFWSALMGSLFVRVGVAWTLGVYLGWGIMGIWWASTLDWVARTAFLGVVFLRGRWAKIVV